MDPLRPIYQDSPMLWLRLGLEDVELLARDSAVGEDQSRGGGVAGSRPAPDELEAGSFGGQGRVVLKHAGDDRPGSCNRVRGVDGSASQLGC